MVPIAPFGIDGWRWVAGVSALAAIVVWIVRLGLLESPRCRHITGASPRPNNAGEQRGDEAREAGALARSAFPGASVAVSSSASASKNPPSDTSAAIIQSVRVIGSRSMRRSAFPLG